MNERCDQIHEYLRVLISIQQLIVRFVFYYLVKIPLFWVVHDYLAHPPLTGTRFSTVEYPALGLCSGYHKNKSLNITFLSSFHMAGVLVRLRSLSTCFSSLAALLFQLLEHFRMPGVELYSSSYHTHVF